jgi:hypothetical protein
MYTETLAIRIQIGDLEKVRDIFELSMLVNITKIDLLLKRISDLNILINNAQIATAFDKLNDASELLVKSYEYFFRECFTVEERKRNNGTTQQRRQG